MEAKLGLKFYEVPVNLDIILYRNNYIDNLIISELRKNAHLFGVSKNLDSFTVDVKDLKKILKRKFRREIERSNKVSSLGLSATVNSAYFINNITDSFNNLQKIKINISKKRNFTRVYDIEDQQIIGFEYKITSGIVDFPRYMTDRELRKMNRLFAFLGINQNTDKISGSPYFTMTTQDFLLKISSLDTDNPELIKKNSEILDIIFEILDSKIEEDNAILTIKTDYPS